MNNINNILTKWLVLLFLTLLLLPNIIMIFGLEREKTNNEKVVLQKFPVINFNSPLRTISTLKNFYLANFGLKKTTVNNYIYFKNTVLEENPIPNKVVQGKDGWFFLGNYHKNVLNNSFGDDRSKRSDIQKIASYLTRIKTYLSKKNIDFIIVIPSDKHRVYQEYLPYQLKQKTTKLQRLKNILKTVYNFDIVDLYEPLMNAKEDNQLYSKTDTHWNDYGAYIGYNEVINKLNINNKSLNLLPIKIEDYNIEKVDFENGDITRLLNLKTNDHYVRFNKKIKSNVFLKDKKPTLLNYINPDKKLKLLMYRDSFSMAWIPFFNETFGESLYIEKYDFNTFQIESYKPDVVIFELIERNIISVLSKKAASNKAAF